MLKLLATLLCLGVTAQAKDYTHYTGYYESLLPLEPAMAEAERIQLHFTLLLEKLERKDLSALTPAQKSARAGNLQHLRAYRDTGRFPQNDYLPYRNPVFIDRQGTYCAVGYLVAASGHPEVSREIADVENFAYVREIKNTKLDPWIKDSGLSKEECAMIQPIYPCACEMGNPAFDCEHFAFYESANPRNVQIAAFSFEGLTGTSAIFQFTGKAGSWILPLDPEPLWSFGEFPVRSAGNETWAHVFIITSVDLEPFLTGLGATFHPTWGPGNISANLPFSKVWDVASHPDVDNVAEDSLLCGQPGLPCLNNYKRFRGHGILPFDATEISSIKFIGVDGGEYAGESVDAPNLISIDVGGAFSDSNKEAVRGKFWGAEPYFMPVTYSSAAAGYLLKPGSGAIPPVPVPTPSPMPLECGPRVDKVVVAPNPAFELSQSAVSAFISGCADNAEVSIYSSGGILVSRWDSPVNNPGNWVRFDFPPGLALGNGTYWVKISARRGAKKSEGTGPMYILK